jgi:hypothetical protein
VIEPERRYPGSGEMKNLKLPSVTFKVYFVNKSPLWLIRKKDNLEAKWNGNQFGNKLLMKIMKTCNLVFPNNMVDAGITVRMSKYSARVGNLGFTYPSRPMNIMLYAKKSDSNRTLVSTLCHELIHSLVWSKSADSRRKSVSYFADIFADELVTTMLEELIIKGSFQRIDFEWALDYACQETVATLKNLKRSNDYDEVLSESRKFFRESRKIMRTGGSDAIKERERLLQCIKAIY